MAPSKYYVLDSSVWIALFIDDDSQHETAVSVMNMIGDDTIVIPYLVLTEVATVLTTKHSFEQAAAFIAFAQNSIQNLLVPDYPESEIQFFLSQKQNLSFIDVTLIGLTLRHSYHLVTFDKKMQKYYQKLLG